MFLGDGMEWGGLYCEPAISARASKGPIGEPEERSIPGGGGRIIGEADERSAGGSGF